LPPGCGAGTIGGGDLLAEQAAKLSAKLLAICLGRDMRGKLGKSG
jgi:hypothetical protein